MLRDVDEAPIAWREAGEGSLVLFLHGLGATRTSWDAQLAALADTHRCVAWDLPGYGASPPLANLTLEAAADSAEADKAAAFEILTFFVQVVGKNFFRFS